MSLALPGWLRHPSPRTKDVALAVLIAVPLVGSAVADGARHHQPLLGLVGLAVAIPLLWRRTRPEAALAATLLIGLGLRDDGGFVFVGLILLYTIASRRSWPALVVSVGSLLGTLVVHRLLWGQPVRFGDILGPAVLCGVAVGIGQTRATRRAQMAALRERAERLDRERELLADQAVSDERVRIARELHDVVAHNVSLMVVQAQALGATFREPPVVEATTGIANLGRETMTEMHRTLRLLRAEDEADPGRSPRPGLANLDRLVEQSRAGGLEVDLAIEGAPRQLSQSLDLSAFRIVQEALTNVRRHAVGADTRVTVGYGPEALELTVRNGPGARAATANGGAGSGHGLTGMRERAALFGGTLVAEPLAGEGFAVRAVLPYGSPPEPGR